MLVSTIRILADETRFQILEVLKSGEKSVYEIGECVNIAQSGVSRHLKILMDNGFVQMRPMAQKRLYSLRPEPFKEISAWSNEITRIWEARLERFGAAVKKIPKN